MGWILFILIGGTAAMVVPFLIARTLVYRQTEPWRGREYLEWFRAQKAAEHDEAVRREIELLAAAAELMRPTQQEWLEQRRRRPNVAAQGAPKEMAR